EHHVTCSTEPIQAEEGDDVRVRFRLDPLVDLSNHTLDVSRPDLSDEVVHAYRDRKDLSEAQMTWYRNRTTLLHEDLQRGRVTLKISSVQLGDSGQYRLFVPDLNTVCDVGLRVAEKGRHHRTTTEAPRTSSKTPEPDPPRQNDAAIVAGVVGGVGGGALLLGLIVGVLVKRGKIKLSSRSRKVCSFNSPSTTTHLADSLNPKRTEAESRSSSQRCSRGGWMHLLSSLFLFM
ncbi:hypothetical protein INR49_018310, partial [Caranx melampygus]